MASNLWNRDDTTTAGIINGDINIAGAIDREVENKVATQKTTIIPKDITGAYTNLVQDPTDLTTGNWTEVNMVLSDSGETINGQKFWKIEANSASIPTIVSAGIALSSSDVVTYSFFARKGNTTSMAVDLFTAGHDDQVSINFDTKVVTPAGGEGTTVTKVVWHDDTTVEIYAKTGVLTITGNYGFRFFGAFSGITGSYSLVSMPQVIITETRFPFIDGTKEADVINENFTMPDKFTLDCEFTPNFSKDASIFPKIAQWYIGGTKQLTIYHNTGSNDNYIVSWRDGGTIVYTQVTPNPTVDTFNTKTRLTVSFEVSNIRFIINQEGYIDGTINTSVMDAKTSVFPTLSIGHEAGSGQADSSYEYLRVYDGLLVGDVTESSDVDQILQSQTLLFDANIDEFKETSIPEGTPTPTAIEMLAQDVKTGVAIQDKAILSRHLSDDANGVNQDIDLETPYNEISVIPKDITQAYTNLVQDPTDLTTGNWVKSTGSVSVADSGETINGYKLWNVLTSSYAGFDRIESAPIVTTQTDYTIRAIIRKSTADECGLVLRDITQGNEVFGAKVLFSTKTLTQTAGGNISYKWHDDNTIEIIGNSSGIVSSDIIECWLLGTYSIDEDAGTDFSQPQITEGTTMYPFIDGSKSADVIDETFTMPDRFTFDMIVTPNFAYDTSIGHRFFVWHINASTSFRCLYNSGAADSIGLNWIDQGTARTMNSPQFDDGTSFTNLNQRLRVVGSVDLISGDQDGSRFIVIPLDSGAINEDTTWNGSPDIKTTIFPSLKIGNEGGTLQADSSYEYLRIYEGLLVGDVTSSDDVTELLATKQLLFDVPIDEYVPISISEGTSHEAGLKEIAQGVKTGSAIADGAIIERHVKDLVFENGLKLTPERKAFQELKSDSLSTSGWYTIAELEDLTDNNGSAIFSVTGPDGVFVFQANFRSRDSARTHQNTTIEILSKSTFSTSGSIGLESIRIAKSDTVNAAGAKLQIEIGFTSGGYTIQKTNNISRLVGGWELVDPYLDNTPTLPDGVTAATFLEAGAELQSISGLTLCDNRFVCFPATATSLRVSLFFDEIPKQASTITFPVAFNFQQPDGTLVYAVSLGETVAVNEIVGNVVTAIITTTGLSTQKVGFGVGASFSAKLS